MGMILSAFTAALGQWSDPRFRRVVLLGVALTLALLVALYAVIVTAIQWMVPETTDLPLIGPVGGLDTLLSVGSVLVMLLASVVLMVPVASAFSGLFLDSVAEAVEGRHYPALPMARPQGLAEGMVAAVGFFGIVLGAMGGYFGGAIDDALEWLYNVFNAIPYVLLIFALAAVFKSGPLAKVFSNGIMNVVVILSLVGWTGIYRLVRAEYIKHRSRDYVRAAEAIGASHFSRLFVHILPNISHVILVQLSLHVVGFIKAEVILSFLGLGVSIDMVSWGTMLSESQTELILGIWWQFLAATAMMAVFVTAFALFTDALRDALDPKIR